MSCSSATLEPLSTQAANCAKERKRILAWYNQAISIARRLHFQEFTGKKQCNNMSDDKVFKVPCFGQPFQLGMLYDCRSHQLVPGPTLWESDILKNASVSRVSPQSRYEVFTSDSLEDKMAILGVDSSLKFSLMTGLVSPSGTGKFIGDQKSSKKQARVTLKYESTSKFEEISLAQVLKGLHRDISAEMTATHFLSGIEYGTEAVFVFDRDVDEKKSYGDVESDLKFTIDSLSRVPVDEGDFRLYIRDGRGRSEKSEVRVLWKPDQFQESYDF
ncbi:hypothetical protein OS493_038734 [Desmophyllum pertusum]|uniref:SNTX MACPF/CDC-like domain-containing protein n=1 Tax=Desmophyllum pertusum TaxID=174260 RepID=A0A9W9ZI81_9CNID|nr:hypothetical protein OS493_038734 [Desmophyllum pertusum]